MIIYIVHNLDSHIQSAHTDGCEAEKAAQSVESAGFRVKVFKHRIETETKTETKKIGEKNPVVESKVVTVVTEKKTSKAKKKTEGKKDFMDRWLDFYKRQRSIR